MIYSQNKKYDVRYINTDGEEKTIQVTPEENMSKPQMIMKLKEKDSKFFKLLENKNLKEDKPMDKTNLEEMCLMEDVDGATKTFNLRDEISSLGKRGLYDYVANEYYKMSDEDLKEIALNAIYVANNDKEIINELLDRLPKEEKVEESVSEKKLMDWLEEHDFEDVDVSDSDVDMLVAYCLDIEEADKDSYNTYLSILAKDLNIVSEGDSLLVVDLSRHVNDNFDLYDSVFDVDEETREDEVSTIVEQMEGLISGYAPNSIYTKLVQELTK